MITFNEEISLRINKWFHIIPKGSQPHHVRQMMTELKCTQNDIVVDPFCGEGTTLIECQIAGIKAIGFEINPFLNFVSNVITNWDIAQELLARQLEDVVLQFSRQSRGATLETVAQLGLRIPPIQNPFSWWREDVLVDLLILKKAIEDKAVNPEIRNFLLLALAGVLAPELSNTRLDGFLLFLQERDHDKIDVLASFQEKVASMQNDLVEISKADYKHLAQCSLLDATLLSATSVPEAINCVITSPPYPARFSFVWNTMPHLFFFGYHTAVQDPSTLDDESIGGTWGSATYNLMRRTVLPEHPVVARLVSPIADSLRSHDALASNHLIKYFNLITKHLLALEHLPQKNFRMAYMIGDAEFGDELIKTDQLLANIIEGLDLGYRVDKIVNCGHYIKKTHPNLQQKIVYAWKKQSKN